MEDMRLLRNEGVIEGNVFVIMPFGTKEIRTGETFDFEEYYSQELVSVIASAGMTSVRADSIYGQQTVLGPIWRGVQQAEVVVVDFTGRSPNVAMEFMMAAMIGKKMICLTQDVDDIPTDVRGRVRHIEYSAHFGAMHRMREKLRRELTAIREVRTVEMALVPMVAGGTDSVLARVISVTKELAVIEAADGSRGVLGNADVEYERIIPDMTRRFSEGDHVSGAFEFDSTGRMKYTMLAGRVNPWNRIVAEFPSGRTFTATVKRVADHLGAFVPLVEGIDGLIHAATLGRRVLEPGDRVEVTVTRLDVTRRRVGLTLDRVLVQPAPAAAPTVFGRGGQEARPTSSSGVTSGDVRIGQHLDGEVVKTCPEGSGGYILVRLPGRRRPAMLHCSAMTDDLRADLNDGHVEIGEIVAVEVVSMDTARDRIFVRDLPDEDGAGSGAGEAEPMRAAS